VRCRICVPSFIASPLIGGRVEGFHCAIVRRIHQGMGSGVEDEDDDKGRGENTRVVR